MNREPTETLLALGVPLIGAAETQSYRLWVSSPSLPDDIVDVGFESSPDLELLQALRPDLILLTKNFAHDEDVLRKIAPLFHFVIYTSAGEPFHHAQDSTLRLGQKLGIGARADAFLTAVDISIAKMRMKLAQADKKPIYMVSFIDERHLMAFGRKSLFQDVLDKLDMLNAWDGRTNFWGFGIIGIEEIAHHPEADILVLGHMRGSMRMALKSNPIWNRIPAVRGGRAFFLPPVWMFGSIPSAERFAKLLTNTLLEKNSMN